MATDQPGSEGGGLATATLGKPWPGGGNCPEQDSTSPRGASSPLPPRLGSGWLEMEGQGERCAVT